jgi:hypothetical protein
MAIRRCPGQDTRFWRPEDISESPCPACGYAIEFFKDEPRRRCPECGTRAPNPNFDAGCAKWCQFAEACLGSAAIDQEEDAALGDTLVEEMKQVFGDDARRIRHALAVLDYAERILEEEPEADPLVVKAAAVLHDIGIHAAEAKYGCAAPKWQEHEGPPIARAILDRHGVDADRAEHVLRIIASHHSAGGIDTPAFRIIWDADHLVNLQDDGVPEGGEGRDALIDRVFRTEAGKRLARTVLPAEGGRPSEAPDRKER